VFILPDVSQLLLNMIQMEGDIGYIESNIDEKCTQLPLVRFLCGQQHPHVLNDIYCLVLSGVAVTNSKMGVFTLPMQQYSTRNLSHRMLVC
jgi:hypothetical protein